MTWKDAFLRIENKCEKNKKFAVIKSSLSV